MIYFIITTCLYDDCPIRKNQYITGISKLKEIVEELKIDNSKIIIVENNGFRSTFLNDLGCEVFYTLNNSIPHTNKGYRELQDILDCIDKYKINDSDFIVKLTGRYILKDNSEFMNIVKDIHHTKYDCVIKYGSYFNPSSYKMANCITGLIGMSCYYVKQIEKPREEECVECNWGRVTYLIDDKNIYLVDNLDVYICPGSNNYFEV
jgi:hypothetical protein